MPRARHADLIPHTGNDGPRASLSMGARPIPVPEEQDSPPPGNEWHPRIVLQDNPEIARTAAVARQAAARAGYEALCARWGIREEYVPSIPTDSPVEEEPAGRDALTFFLTRWAIHHHHPGLNPKERARALSGKELRSMYQSLFWAYNRAMSRQRFGLALYIAIRFLRYTPEESLERRRNFDPIREREEDAVIALYDQVVAPNTMVTARFLRRQFPIIEWHLAAKYGYWEDAYAAMKRQHVSARRRIETLRGYYAFLRASKRDDEARTLATRYPFLVAPT